MIKTITILGLSITLAFSVPITAWAISSKYYINNIIFYNPDSGCTTKFNLGNIDASGEYNENAIFAIVRLLDKGYSAEAVAGIVGNLKAEGSVFNPGEVENAYGDDITDTSFRITKDWVHYGKHGFGIAQWTSAGRQDNLQKLADERNQPVIDLGLQVEFLITELSSYKYTSEKMNTMSIEEATFEIYRRYETPGSSFWTTHNGIYYNDYAPGSLSELSETKTPAAYNEYKRRLSYAYGALETIKKNNLSSSSLSSGSSVSVDGSEVTIIGDSITVRSTNDILKLLPKADVNAQESKVFYTSTNSDNPGGYDILKSLTSQSKLRSILVYALGTNSSITEKQINDVISEAGSKTKIIFVNNYSVSNHDYTANNNALANAAANNSNVSLVNWNSIVSQNSSTYMDDDVHPKNGAGTELFAKSIYDGVSKVSSGSISYNTCSEQSDDYNYSVTSINYANYTYVFPLAGATKSNFLDNSTTELESVLSSQSNGWYHHDYKAVDLGLRKKLINENEYTANDFSGQSFSAMYYYSTGVKVLALVDGTITSYKTYSRADSDYVSKCSSVSYKGVDGKTYWFGHMSYDSKYKAGDTFKAGDEIGVVGPPQCALNTQAHLHINVSPQEDDVSNSTLVDIIDKLYEELPEK